MTLSAPAKINLSLKILGKRPDGFHDIETLMVPIRLADDLTLEKIGTRGVEVVCDDPAVPTGPENLVVRAAARFFCEAGEAFGLRIELKKRIPLGAGLGGGSSDAAAVLKGLNALTGAGFDVLRLEAMAADIGSDVAWFIRGEPAMCRGRGELIEPAPPVPGWPLLLLKPPFGVPTPWAYQAFAAASVQPAMRQTLGEVEISNDLETPVFQKFVLLPVMKAWLLGQPGVRVAAMSGSGSTMFAVLESADLADGLAAKARAQFGETLWCESCQIGTFSAPDATLCATVA